MAHGLFITGTDTDVGKTTVALGLMSAFQEKGLTVAAMKPVSAGCIQTPEGLRNDDAVRLMQQASIDLPYDIVNPYAFAAPVAPHIAATEQNVHMNIATIQSAYNVIVEQVDIVIVEGAGGWLVPINETETMADVAKALALDVIQVVGLRLGCLNHALLTVNNIESMGLIHRGWIANHLSAATERTCENVAALRLRIAAPCLEEVHYGTDPIKLMRAVDLLSE